MGALTISNRTFAAAGNELEHPVDALGRVRWRSTLDTRAVERREDGEPIGFKGHAAVFNSRTWIGGKSWGFWEQIDPRAFRKTLNEADVRFLINHDPNLLLARNRAGTLRLSTDDVGLEVDADMAPVSYAEDLAVLLARKDITQMSFAFEPISWRYEQAEDGKDLYTLTEVRLFDVSVVTYPAYEDTDAALRAAAFESISRSLGVEPAVLLRSVADGADDQALAELLGRASSPPAETTGPDHPDEPPAETTDLVARSRAIRVAELAAQSRARGV